MLPTRLTLTEKEEAVQQTAKKLFAETKGGVFFEEVGYRESSMLFSKDLPVYQSLINNIINTYYPEVKRQGGADRILKSRFVPLLQGKLDKAKAILGQVIAEEKAKQTPPSSSLASSLSSPASQSKRAASFAKDVQRYQTVLDVYLSGDRALSPQSNYPSCFHQGSTYSPGLAYLPPGFQSLELLACYFLAATDEKMKVYKHKQVTQEDQKEENKEERKEEKKELNSTDVVPLTSLPNWRETLDSSSELFITMLLDLRNEYGPHRPSCPPGSAGRIIRQGAGVNALGTRPPILNPWSNIVNDVKTIILRCLKAEELKTKESIYNYFIQSVAYLAPAHEDRQTFLGVLKKIAEMSLQQLAAHLQTVIPQLPHTITAIQIKLVQKMLLLELNYLQEGIDDPTLLVSIIDTCRDAVVENKQEKLINDYQYRVATRSIGTGNLLDILITALNNDLSRGLCFPTYLGELDTKKIRIELVDISSVFKELEQQKNKAITAIKLSYEEAGVPEEQIPGRLKNAKEKLDVMDNRLRQLIEKFNLARDINTRIDSLYCYYFDEKLSLEASKFLKEKILSPEFQKDLLKPFSNKCLYTNSIEAQTYYLVNTAYSSPAYAVCRLVNVMSNHFAKDPDATIKIGRIARCIHQWLTTETSDENNPKTKAYVMLKYAFEQNNLDRIFSAQSSAHNSMRSSVSGASKTLLESIASEASDTPQAIQSSSVRQQIIARYTKRENVSSISFMRHTLTPDIKEEKKPSVSASTKPTRLIEHPDLSQAVFVDTTTIVALFREGKIAIVDLGNAEKEGFGAHMKTMLYVWAHLFESVASGQHEDGSLNWMSYLNSHMNRILETENRIPAPSPFQVVRKTVANPTEIAFTLIWSTTNKHAILGRLSEERKFIECGWWTQHNGKTLTQESARDLVKQIMGIPPQLPSLVGANWRHFKPIPEPIRTPLIEQYFSDEPASAVVKP